MVSRRHAVGIQLDPGALTTSARFRVIMRFLNQLYDTAAVDGIEEERPRTHLFVIVGENQTFSLAPGIQAFCGDPGSFFKNMADGYDDVSFFPSGLYPHVVPGMKYRPTLLIPTAGQVSPWSMMKIPAELIRRTGEDLWPDIDAVAVWLWGHVMWGSLRETQVCYAGFSFGGEVARVQSHLVPYTTVIRNRIPWDRNQRPQELHLRPFMECYEEYRQQAASISPSSTELEIWEAYERGEFVLPALVSGNREEGEVQYAGIGDWAQYRSFRGCDTKTVGPESGEPSEGSIAARSFDLGDGEQAGSSGEATRDTGAAED